MIFFGIAGYGLAYVMHHYLFGPAWQPGLFILTSVRGLSWACGEVNYYGGAALFEGAAIGVIGLSQKDGSRSGFSC